MPKNKKTELERLEILRLSNVESNRITKTCIETALIKLLENKCLGDISITDIVKRAGVSRTAYYRNYNSKENILQSIMEEIIESVIDSMNLSHPINNTYENWYSLFNAVGEYNNIFKILLKAGLGDTILSEIHNKMQTFIQANNQENYKLCFWIGAIYNVTVAWIKDGMQETTEEIARICYKIIDSVNGNCTSYIKD